MKHRAIFGAMLVSVLTACGAATDESASSPLIVGGNKAPARPFMAALVRAGTSRSFCGGTFVEPDVVLTAAHCVASRPSGLRVAGGHRQNRDLTPDRTVPVDSIVIHEDYDSTTNANDIALLFLSAQERSFGSVRPAQVSASVTLPEATGAARVAGWGVTSFGGPGAEELLEVQVPIIGVDTCKSAGGPYATVDGTQICAGDFENGGKDSCQGDSGGPLFVERGGSVQVIGVVSWGEGCASAHKPGVYTRVASFKGWMADALRAR
jgi:secreted trypsin-like serine protease